MIIIISHITLFNINYSHMYANAQKLVFGAALNDGSESLEVTGTGNAFQTVAAACTNVQSPAAVRDLF